MNLTIISDIHGSYKNFPVDTLQPADALLIAGDITNTGSPAQVKKAKDWIDTLKPVYKDIFYVFGNHDLGLGFRDFDSLGVTCVQDKVIEYEGLLIAGANLSVCYNLPILKKQWTHMTDNPKFEEAYYDTLPVCDILISHSPPAGKLGLSSSGEQCGSEKLLDYIKRVQPRLVVCGHIHEAAGAEYVGKTLVINTALRSYKIKGVDNWNIELNRSQASR